MKTITTANLAEATPQQVFDFVVSRIIAQGRPATSGAACMYRRPDGLACAAGQLLNDEEAARADASTVGKRWSAIVDAGFAPSAHKELISQLQDCHDTTDRHDFVERFKHRALVLAQRRNLTWNF